MIFGIKRDLLNRKFELIVISVNINKGGQSYCERNQIKYV